MKLAIVLVTLGGGAAMLGDFIRSNTWGSADDRVPNNKGMENAKPTGLDVVTVNRFHQQLTAICIDLRCEIVYGGAAAKPIRAKGARVRVDDSGAAIWSMHYYSDPRKPNTYELLFSIRLTPRQSKETVAVVKVGADTLYVELVSTQAAALKIDDRLPFPETDPKRARLTVRELLKKLEAAKE